MPTGKRSKKKREAPKAATPPVLQQAHTAVLLWSPTSDDCYNGRHQKGKRREHSYAWITDQTPICTICNDAVQFRFCEQCERGHW